MPSAAAASVTRHWKAWLVIVARSNAASHRAAAWHRCHSQRSGAVGQSVGAVGRGAGNPFRERQYAGALGFSIQPVNSHAAKENAIPSSVPS